MQNIYGYNSMLPLVSKFPKGCTADCRNGDEGCCEEQWRACKPFPDGNCTKNCMNDLKCKNILGCTEQEETGDCIASSSPSPSPSGGGCYRFDGTVCEEISPDSCDNPVNKQVCANYNCYNGEEQCLKANQHSPSPPPSPGPSPKYSPSPPTPSPSSPSGFLSTTTGKIIVILIVMLVLLGLIWLTYVVTKRTNK
jgi:hypothetical protein